MIIIKKKTYSSDAFCLYFGILLGLPVKDMDETLELFEMENESEEINLIENLSFADILRKLLSIPEVGCLDITNYLP